MAVMTIAPCCIGDMGVQTALAQQTDEGTVNVRVSAQFGQEFLYPAKQIAVKPGTAAAHGFVNGESVPEGSVTCLDVLVAAHIDKYGESIADYLKMNNYGNPTEIFGNENTDKFSGFSVNHSYPKDENNQGYSVNTAPVSEGDAVDFFYYEDEYYCDYLTWFEDESGKAVDEVKIAKGEDKSLYLKGFMYMAGYSNPVPEPVFNQENGLTAYEADENGNIGESIGDITNQEGMIQIPTDTVGTYYLTAQGFNDDMCLVIMPWCKVTVTDSQDENPGNTEQPSDPGQSQGDSSQGDDSASGKGEESLPDNQDQSSQGTAQWKNFRNSDKNMAVVSAPLARNAEEAELKWNQVGSSLSNWGFYYPCSYIIVNNKIIAAGGNRIAVINPESGEVEKTVEMSGSKEYSYMPPVYGGGMIYVALNGGKIQAFDGVTLEPKWIYEDPIGGQALSNITYADGYIYTGFTKVNSKIANNFVAINVRDEDTSRGDENKEATWNYQHIGGFYWAGALVQGKYIIVGGENKTLLVFDKETGLLTDSKTVDGDIRSSITEEGGRLYFVTKEGGLYKAEVNQENGKIDKIDVLAKLEAGSTSTPVIVKEKAYVALYNKKVAQINLQTKEVTTVDTPAASQSSLLANTYYEGKTYLYLTCNSKPGSLDVIEVDDLSGKMTYSRLYIPEEKLQNFTASSVICDSDGTTYFTNDSGNIFAVDNINKPIAVDKTESDEDNLKETEAKAEDTSAADPESPKTGDYNNAALWIMSMVLSIAVGIGIAIILKKKVQENAGR